MQSTQCIGTKIMNIGQSVYILMSQTLNKSYDNHNIYDNIESSDITILKISL